MTDLLTLNDRPGAYPDSYYAATAGAAEPRPPLDGDRTAHVCIIGAGYTGLSAALHLAGKGLEVVVLEAQRVGWGASGRNGGQVSGHQRLPQSVLERMVGKDRARQLFELAQEARDTVGALIADHRIDCDLRPGVLYAEFTDKGARAAKREARHLREAYGYDRFSVLDREALRGELGTEAYAGGVLDRGAAHLHPLNYALGLARAASDAGVAIHEGTRVTGVEPGRPNTVRTATGSIRADRVLYAGNGYLAGLEPQVARRVMPINNFMIATEPLGQERAAELIRNDIAVADSKFVVNYYRLSADKRLLFGGGESYGYRFPADIAGLVRPNMLAIYPQLAGVKIEHAWGGTLAITRNRFPHFAALDQTRLSASGFSGHGVAMATLAGKLMARYVLGAPEGFESFAKVPVKAFPGGATLRQPILVAAMSWYALRDRLGI